jgi:LemA protein
MAALLIVVAIVAVVIFMLVGTYNRLVGLRQNANQAFADIDVQLKQRQDLIPNLVETVKGYAAHEKGTLEAVISARNAAMAVGGGDVAQKAQAENVLSGALRQLFALSEAYPNLKANENFASLQEELTGTENRISFARQYYNDSVSVYNTACQTFPNNVLAGAFGFKQRDFFQVEAPAEREAPKVKF